MLPFLENAERARRFEDLSMEDSKAGAKDSDGGQVGDSARSDV